MPNRRADAYCQSRGGIQHFSVSAKDNSGVEAAFETVARMALAMEEQEEYGGGFEDPIDINLDNERDGCAC